MMPNTQLEDCSACRSVLLSFPTIITSEIISEIFLTFLLPISSSKLSLQAGLADDP